MRRLFRRFTRILFLSLLAVSVFVPIFLLSLSLKHFRSDESKEFIEDLSIIKHRTEARVLHAIGKEEGEGVKEPFLVVYKDGEFNNSDILSSSSIGLGSLNENNQSHKSGNSVGNANLFDRNGGEVAREEDFQQSNTEQRSLEVKEKGQYKLDEVQNGKSTQPQPRRVLDAKVKEIKDQMIRAKAYLQFVPPGSNSHFVKELKLRTKELERVLGEASKDSDLSRRAQQKMKAMESTLLKAKRMYPDCSAMVKKLWAMTYNAEEQARTQKNQARFLVQIAGRTTPKGLHCLSMRLTTEYFALRPEERKHPNQDKLSDPDLYHFAVFSDNVLACSVVVNSTVSAAGDQKKIVFHVVTDSLNFPAMSMWFLLNPPGKAAIQIQNLDEFEWFSAAYDETTVKQNYTDPRFISALNHLRFYLPDVFPMLNKVVLLDHDVVVQKDLTGLWRIDMKGKVNGAVPTCQEGDPSFRRMDMFINFTDPMVAKGFNAKTCTWAFGLNVFDLQEWRRQNLTGVYHKYLQLGRQRPLLKAGSLPIGWMTFYRNTISLNKRWQVLGLGYDSGVRLEDINRSALIHFDGVMKPWLDIGIERYKTYWKKHVKYEHPYLQQCNIHE